MIRKQPVKGSDQIKVTFIVPDDQPHTNASVVGDFNNWDPAANKLKKRINQTYSASVTLDAGRRYAFRYMTPDGHWFNDEAADGYEASGFGSDNCIVET